MEKPDADEIAQVLLDGARRLCDHATEQWMGYKYGNDEDMRRENLRRWSRIRQALPTKKELRKLLQSLEETAQ